MAARTHRVSPKRIHPSLALRSAWNVLRDPENTAAHYGLAQIYTQLGRDDGADRHRQLHAKYRVDDNARDVAVAAARRNDPAADHAANEVVIYDLQRHGAFGLDALSERIAAR